ncbi:hypothetical protein BB561_000998 [Smittium simulii]|uniref:Uncharacterized protein n=1 Tax=Smittium simulii TaxID=133385 RepID=A0A2T9YWN0_9FUNG|nr:hypothetical protein BB561_000998 [Smittium simulii]
MLKELQHIFFCYIFVLVLVTANKLELDTSRVNSNIFANDKHGNITNTPAIGFENASIENIKNSTMIKYHSKHLSLLDDQTINQKRHTELAKIDKDVQYNPSKSSNLQGNWTHKNNYIQKPGDISVINGLNSDFNMDFGHSGNPSIDSSKRYSLNSNSTLNRRSSYTSESYSYSYSQESSYTGATQSSSSARASSSSGYKYGAKSYTGVTCSSKLKMGGASNYRGIKSNNVNVAIYGKTKKVCKYANGANRRVVSSKYVNVNPYLYRNYGGNAYRFVNQNKYKTHRGQVYAATKRSGYKRSYRRVNNSSGNYRSVNGYVYAKGHSNKYRIQNGKVMRRINTYAPVTGNVKTQGIIKGYVTGYIGGRRVYRQPMSAAINGNLDENGSLGGSLTVKLKSGMIIRGNANGKATNINRARMYNYRYGYRIGRKNGYYSGYRRGYYNRVNGINRGVYKSRYGITVAKGKPYTGSLPKSQYKRYGYRNRYYNVRRATSRYNKGYKTTRRYMNKYKVSNRAQLYGGYRAGYRSLTNYAKGDASISKSSIVGPYKSGYGELKSQLYKYNVPGKEQILANYINNYRAIYRYVYRPEIIKKYELINGYDLGYNVGYKKAYKDGYKKGSSPGAPSPSNEQISEAPPAVSPVQSSPISTFGSCGGISFQCTGTGSSSYYECVHGSYQQRQCGENTFCYPYNDNPKTIICGSKK